MAVSKSFRRLASRICKVAASPGRHIECSVYYVHKFRSNELKIDPEQLWCYTDKSRGTYRYVVDTSWARDKSWQTPFLFDKTSDILHIDHETGVLRESLFMLGTLDSSDTDINLIIVKDGFEDLYVVHLAVTLGNIEWSDSLRKDVFREVIKLYL